MRRGEREYLTALQGQAADARRLFSNAMKPERERMVVKAFLRCIGESFKDDEVQVGQSEPVDVMFRSARFQVRDIVGDKKRGEEWKQRQRQYEEAQSLDELWEPYAPSVQIAFGELSGAVAEALVEKAARYGGEVCKQLDALVYFDPGDRHLYPPVFELTDAVATELSHQGWRSVSVLSVPYGIVLAASRDAPEFLRKNVAHILKEWPDDKAGAGLFD
jgi:hypothetical protein